MESADSRRLATKHSRKALKASLTLGILLGMFFVTWLPFFVANIAQVMPLRGAGASRPRWGGPRPPPQPVTEGGRWAAARGVFGWVCPGRAGLGGGRGGVCVPAPAPGVTHPSLQAVCDCVSPGLFDVLTWLGYCNSTMNPIIYPLFMRDFKRALAKLLPCPHWPQEPRASVASPSMRTSHSGARPGLSLQHVLPLPLPPDSDSDPDSGSGASSGLQLPARLLLPGEATRDALPPARTPAAVNFFNRGPVEPQLRLHLLGAPTN